ncbi:MAG: hypothetical protein LBH10_04550 [Burkholderiaceae bacterium]|nr:hypothetical protein [Burkholderiaceae bacterium]
MPAQNASVAPEGALTTETAGQQNRSERGSRRGRAERGDFIRSEHGDIPRAEHHDVPRFNPSGERAEPANPVSLDAAPAFQTAETAVADFDPATDQRPQRRERHTRDLYGRDHRRGRTEGGEASGESAPYAEPSAPAPQPAQNRADAADDGQTPHSYFTRRAVADPAATAAMQTPAEPASVSVVEAAAAPTPAAPAQPLRAQPYALPEADLTNLAQTAGLEWVGSDPGKVAAAQAAIAAEPHPAPAPRERPPAVAQPDEPLVLVETQQDLRAATLPFEPPKPPQSGNDS